MKTLTPEQKLIRLRAVSKVYKRAIVAYERYLAKSAFEDMSACIHLMPWQRRIDRCERYIERLTAPAEPEPAPETEAKSDYNWTFPVRPSSTPSNWPCCICGELSVTDRENRPVCDEHRAMLDSGVFTMDELLYGDDDDFVDDDDTPVGGE